MTAAPAGRRPEETEVKLPCADLDALRAKLREDGATLRSARHEESNVLYDDAKEELSGRGGTLRLRTAASETILTFKGPARFEGGIKVREEREVRVSDAAEAEALLIALGFRPKFRYEKRREEWDLDDCAIALDETPIGSFVEIEGDPSAIRRALQALGLDFSEAIPYTYAELYRRRRRDDGLRVSSRPGQ